MEALPDIPRWYTGVAEWAAVMVYISILGQRFRGKRFYLLAGLTLPLMILLQLMLGTWPIEFWVPGMILAVLAMYGIIYLFTDSSLHDAGYLATRAFVLAELVASLQWQLEAYGLPAVQQGAPHTSDQLRILYLALFYGLCFSVARYAEKQNFPNRIRLGIDSRTLITSLGIAFVTFAVSNISFISTNTPFSGQSSGEIFYIRTLVDLAGFVALYTQQSNRNKQHDAMELAKTKMFMRAQHEQYLQSKRNIDELNRMHHDLKYYSSIIREESSAARRGEYLQALEDSLRGYESEVQTGNPVLDVILSSKMERCLQADITMTYIVDGSALYFMDSISLSAFFGNALDNAIEASLNLAEPERRVIKVLVRAQGDFVLLGVENVSDRPVRFHRGLPETTKADRSRHGYGTQNMKTIVEQHGGSITFSQEDGWFKVRALLSKR